MDANGVLNGRGGSSAVDEVGTVEDLGVSMRVQDQRWWEPKNSSKAYKQRVLRDYLLHIMNRAFAVAAQAEGVGHVSAAILAEVEGVFALMWVLWVAVRYDHLGQGEAIEGRTGLAAFILIAVGEIVEDDAFAVVKADVDIPILPGDLAAVDFERDAFGLGDVDGFDIRSVTL